MSRASPGLRSTVAALLLAVACWGADDGAGPQAPLPRSIPLAPVQQDAAAMNAEDRLLNDLDRAQRQREERIQAILRAAAGVRPVAAADLGAGLERPRAERDKALADLRSALDDWLGRTHRSDRDVLDQASAARQAAQVTPLSAENRVAIAECMRDLALEEHAVDRERWLRDGLAEVTALPPEVAEHLRPRVAWLNIFFLAELARLPGEAAVRADQAARARSAADAFPGAFPGSELVAVVAALVADLPTAQP